MSVQLSGSNSFVIDIHDPSQQAGAVTTPLLRNANAKTKTEFEKACECLEHNWSFKKCSGVAGLGLSLSGAITWIACSTIDSCSVNVKIAASFALVIGFGFMCNSCHDEKDSKFIWTPR